MTTPFASAQRTTSRRPLTWRTWLGLFLVPAVLGGLLVWAAWKPTDQVTSIPAAIVNLDKPVTIKDQLVPLGRVLAGQLVTQREANLAWVLTDPADAEAGLRDARYALVLTIPETFSAAATSTAGDPAKAVQASLDLRTSQDTALADRAVGQSVAQVATRTLNAQLTKTYLDNIYVGFSTLNSKLGQAADGAGKLKTGAGQLATGAAAVSSGVAGLADGLAQLATGANALAAGDAKIADGMKQLAAKTAGLGEVAKLRQGTAGIANGLRQAADGMRQQSAQVPQLAAGAQQVSDGLTTLAKSTAQLPQAVSGLAPAVSALADGTDRLVSDVSAQAASLSSLSGAIQGIVADCRANSSDPQYCARLASQLGAIGNKISPPSSSELARLRALAAGAKEAAAGTNTLATQVGALSAGVAQLRDGAAAVSGGVGKIAAGSTTAAGQFDQLAKAAGALDAGLATFAESAPQLRAAIQKLADATAATAAGSAKLASGAREASSGAGRLAKGATGISSGAGELTKGAGSLSDGLSTATKAIPTYSDADRATLSSVAATPVVARGAELTSDSSSAGLFAALALWAGALGTFMVLRAVPRQAWRSRDTTRAMIGRTALAVLSLALIQSLVFSVVTASLTHLDLMGWLGLFAVMLAADVTFLFVNAALVALWGNAGRLAAAIILVVTLIGGIWGQAPGFIGPALSVLPTDGALMLLRAVLIDGRQAGAGAANLLVWVMIGVAVLVWATERRRSVRLSTE